MISSSRSAFGRRPDDAIMTYHARHRVSQLSVALVRRDRDGVRKVDAARVLARHRDAEEMRAVSFVKVLRQTGRFVAEYKRVARLEPAFIQRPFAARRKKVESAQLHGREIILSGVMQRNVQMRPVV